MISFATGFCWQLGDNSGFGPIDRYGHYNIRSDITSDVNWDPSGYFNHFLSLIIIE
jgi:hypothetical protein